MWGKYLQSILNNNPVISGISVIYAWSEALLQVLQLLCKFKDFVL